MTLLCFGSSFAPEFPRAKVEIAVCQQKAPNLRLNWRAVASKDNRTSEEIQRLTQKLEELRALREQVLAKKKGGGASSSPVDSPTVVPKARRASVKAKESASISEELEFGKHGEGSRFLSFSAVAGEEEFPRVIPLLDDLPSLQPADISKCSAIGETRKTEPGRLRFARVPPGFNAHVFAMPVSGVLADLVNPIAIAVSPDVVASNLSVDDGSMVVLIVERNLDDLEWDKYKFYVWGVDNEVRIGWLSDMPPRDEAECLGRVICAFMEEPAERRKAKSCWAEESETYYG